MRKIFYNLTKESYIDTLTQFCNMENITAILYSKQASEEYKGLFYLTDDEKGVNQVLMAGIPVCLITSENRQSRTCYLINEEFGVASLRMLLDNIHHGDYLWNASAELEPVSIHKKLILHNDLSVIERFVCITTRELLYFCTFSDLEKIRIGLSEMITNAIEHGNLNITNQEKYETTENGTYNELVKKRCKDPRYMSRKVYLTFDATLSGVTVLIRDQGEGFNINEIPSPTDVDRLMLLHGRGILITKTYFDSVEYNETGNEVTLKKSFLF